jgi:hypothetical protein
MKKIMYVLSALALAALCLSACKKDPQQDLDNAVEDGFYVAGAATGVTELAPQYMMTAGINEAAEQTKRDGMYEKYIVLDGNKDFELLLYTAGKKTRYSAKLNSFTPEEGSTIYGEDPQMPILKGTLATGDAAPAMKVGAKGLYHIVLDLNKGGDLANAQIIVAPVEWGVRGGMNGWGFTKLEATEVSNDGITYTLGSQELLKNGEFKFAYGGAWKITLDDAGKVRANTNLGNTEKDVDHGPLAAGGENIKVEKHGLYDISMKFKLAAGELGASYSYTITLKEEIADTAPEHMYMIGEQWGSWGWESPEIVELIGVPNAPGIFWCTRWFEASKGFKFCAQKAWSGDFTGISPVGYTVNDGNCWVAVDGLYTVFVNGNDNDVEIMPAEIYGIGSAWGSNAWDYNATDPVKFTPSADGKTVSATVTNNDDKVRIASKVLPSKSIEGVTTPNGWLDWWKSEFVPVDGKIVYRGASTSDPQAVKVTAGQTITLDFNAGTAEVK